jgi:hypothetical protein
MTLDVTRDPIPRFRARVRNFLAAKRKELAQVVSLVISSGGQSRQFLQTAMDVNFDEGCRLAGHVRGAFDAEALQHYQANDASLGGLQLAKEILHRNATHGCLVTILERYFVVHQHG